MFLPLCAKNTGSNEFNRYADLSYKDGCLQAAVIRYHTFLCGGADGIIEESNKDPWTIRSCSFTNRKHRTL